MITRTSSPWRIFVSFACCALGLSLSFWGGVLWTGLKAGKGDFIFVALAASVAALSILVALGFAQEDGNTRKCFDEQGNEVKRTW